MRGAPTDTFQRWQSSVIYRSSFSEGEMTSLLVPNYDTTGYFNRFRLGDVTSVDACVSERGDTLLTFVWQQPSPHPDSVSYFRSYLSQYNLSTETYVYDRVVLNDYAWNGVLLVPMQVVGGRVYMSVGNSLMCHDFETGRRMWFRRHRGEMFFAGFAVDDGFVFGISEDLRTHIYSSKFGTKILETTGPGTSTRLEDRVLNGVIYFGGGSDETFYAVEVATGKVLWRVPGRSLGGGSWQQQVSVIPGRDGKKGVVVFVTGGKAMGFEAAR